MAFCLTQLSDLVFEPARWYELGAFSVFGLSIYVGAIALMKEFAKKDLLFFLNLMNMGKLSRYIRTELKD